MKHKKIIISLSLVFFLLILNFIINNIAANKINSEIQNQIKILENSELELPTQGKMGYKKKRKKRHILR